MDDRNGDMLWQDEIKTEVYALMYLKCFEFNPKLHNTGEGWKGTTLHMVFSIKQGVFYIQNFRLIGCMNCFRLHKTRFKITLVVLQHPDMQSLVEDEMYIYQRGVPMSVGDT